MFSAAKSTQNNLESYWVEPFMQIRTTNSKAMDILITMFRPLNIPSTPEESWYCIVPCTLLWISSGNLILMGGRKACGHHHQVSTPSCQLAIPSHRRWFPLRFWSQIDPVNGYSLSMWDSEAYQETPQPVYHF